MLWNAPLSTTLKQSSEYSDLQRAISPNAGCMTRARVTTLARSKVYNALPWWFNKSTVISPALYISMHDSEGTKKKA